MLPGSGRRWFFPAWQEKWRESLSFVFSPGVSLNTNRAESVLDHSDGHSLLLQASKVEARIKRFSFGSRVKRWMKARALISPFTLWKAEQRNRSRLRSENKVLPPRSGSCPCLTQILPPCPLQREGAAASGRLGSPSTLGRRAHGPHGWDVQPETPQPLALLSERCQFPKKDPLPSSYRNYLEKIPSEKTGKIESAPCRHGKRSEQSCP